MVLRRGCDPSTKNFGTFSLEMAHVGANSVVFSFILVPIDFSYTTSYRLSIVTFALKRNSLLKSLRFIAVRCTFLTNVQRYKMIL